MSVIVNKYLNLHSFAKIAVGGAVSATVAYALGSTNPVTIAALSVLGQTLAWLPDVVRRRYAQAPLRDAIALPVAAYADEALVLPVRGAAAASAEDEDMRRAIAASLVDVTAHDETRAIQLAIERSQRMDAQVYTCPYTDAIGLGEEDGVFIPETLLLTQTNGKHCNAAVFLLSLLTKADCRVDMFGNLVDIDDVVAATNILGIDPESFLNIWGYVSGPGGIHHVDPAEEGSLRTTARVELFRTMVKNRDAIRFYEQNCSAIWF